MSVVADPQEAPPQKKSKRSLLIGIVLAIAGGGGGFALVQLEILPSGNGTETAASHGDEEVEPLLPVAFVPLDPLVVSIPSETGRSYLRFTAQLEVRPQYASEVELLKPRIVDVLNGYLRVVAASELEDPTALVKLRAQMLRRLQIVAGEGRIRDLLIMEFVLN